MLLVEISWLGRTCFRLRGREGAVLTDPVAASTGYGLGRTSAEVVTLSRSDDPEISNHEGVRGDPLVVEAPGEYEVRGILITGIPIPREDGRTMAFAYEIDGVNIVHLGLPSTSPDSKILERFENVDVLLMPVGGGGSLSASVAADLMQRIDPNIVVPMNYRTDLDSTHLDPIDRFLSEAGNTPEPNPRLTVTRASIPSELTVEVLKPRGS
ncbi:MAG TPA: hypothetical protein DGL25_03485 [Dehalococcoidia bacterium]|nr:hypothetical protein [Dehalococcoidia bacterium]|tara:strand:- start:6716 stop:7348 length:633 start_codon:yes stop_codon:yes gene_type:complete